MVRLRKSFECAIAITACAFLLRPSFADTEETVKRLRLAYTGFGVGTAVALVAKDAGLFKRYGLEIENVYIDDAPTGGVQALIGVDVFLGSGNPVVPLQAILEGADIIFLGSHSSLEHYRFGVSPDIASINNSRGKKLGYPGSAENRISLLAWQYAGPGLIR